MIQHILNLIVSLSECHSHALESLHVKFDLHYIREDRIASRNYVLGFDDVVPLLPYKRLTDLRLYEICASSINDASLKTLAQSWCQLEQFYFGGTACWQSRHL
jgi:hypothetical protein